MEYDLAKSSVEKGIIFNDFSKPSTLLEMSAVPTALLWHPHMEEDLEDKYEILYQYMLHFFIV